VPRLRRTGSIGLALTVYDVWRRLPPRQRKMAFDLARKHGPRAAAKVMAMQRARRTKNKP
jgi:hypothetical protein